ncbi:TPA_asm: US11.5 [Human alphaherpesvirus 1]|nr:TPA_asm: US11.5 [Human alphaherpesvirus 1]
MVVPGTQRVTGLRGLSVTVPPVLRCATPKDALGAISGSSPGERSRGRSGSCTAVLAASRSSRPLLLISSRTSAYVLGPTRMVSRKVSAISRAHDMLPPDEQEAVHATVAAGRLDEDVPPAGRHERG